MVLYQVVGRDVGLKITATVASVFIAQKRIGGPQVGKVESIIGGGGRIWYMLRSRGS